MKRVFRPAWLPLPVFAGILSLLLVLPVRLRAGEATLQILPADTAFLAEAAGMGSAAAVAPAPEQVVLAGRFSQAAFSVARLDQVELLGPDGKPLPLVFDESGIAREFDQIVGIRFYALLPAAAVIDDGTAVAPTCVLRWGDGVKAEMKTVPAFRLPQDPGKVRSFSWTTGVPAAGNKGSGQDSTASIEIVADSTANYHSLWYLLPMALILSLLAVRKAYS